MKKILIAMGFVVLAASASAEEIAIAVHVEPGSEMYRVAERIKDGIEVRSDGKLSVVLLGQEVGGERDQLEATTSGEYQITLGGSVPLSLYAPAYAGADLPFVWESTADARKTYEGEMGAAIQRLLKQNGNLHLVGLSERTPRELTSSSPVRTPQDIKGARLRVPEIPAWIEVWSAVGALPSPVAWPEVYTSLQTGVIQMQENPVANISTGKLHEVQKYLNLTGHVYSFYHWLANDAWFAGLSEENRSVVEAAVADAIVWGNEQTQSGVEAIVQELKEKGMEVIDVDKAAFREAANPAIRKIAQGYAPELRDYVLSKLD